MKGILGEKLGMTQVFDSATNRAIPVTVIKAGPCRVAQVKTQETDGYWAIQMAFGDRKSRRINRPEKGHLDAAGIMSARKLAELRLPSAAGYSPGQEITVDIFEPAERVDVVGVSKGKGYTGVMKRHNFGGLGSSHGTHRVHRHPGAIGACATPARVFKGTRMAGQHGHSRTTVLNLEVVEVDPERHLLLVKGAVPGPNGSILMVRQAVKA
jgi:large subunit ribosomal protein L3